MKIHRTSARLVAVLMLGVAAAPFVVAATPAKAEPVLACSIKLASDSVQVSAQPISVDASLSEAIGDSVSAAVQQESKASVVSVGAAGANAVKLTLNTSEAVPGDWSLSLKGTAGECTGKMKIIAAAQ